MLKSSRKKIRVYSSSQLRAIVIFCVIMCGIALSCIQIALVNLRQFNAVSNVNTSKSLVLGESRGLIYDSNMKKLVGEDYSYVCAVKPSVKALVQLSAVLDKNEYDYARDCVNNQTPYMIKTDCIIEGDDIICEKIYNRYSENQLAAHLIGYTDNSGTNGLCGIESAYNGLLQDYSGYIKVRFFTNGKGAVMLGSEAEKTAHNYNSPGGVVLTIDKYYQEALESAVDTCGLKKGAAVMLDIETGAVVASVSRPGFDPNKISEYLDDSDSALFNRALGVYPVGSVFKPLVAASALEQGVDPQFEVDCKGVVAVGSESFGCTKSHGKVNMATALVYSCNCYFVELMKKIDCSQVIDLAASLGFGNAVELDGNIKTYSGNLPNTDELKSLAARANLSFGQGNLTSNPFQIAMLYSMIANGGEYVPAYLVKGFIDADGNIGRLSTSKPPVKLVSEKNSKLLKDILELAVREGTGQSASVSGMDTAGKTATAQTGEFTDGKERLVTWFAGFFPYDAPKYVAVIVCEDGVSGSKDCAPVFSKLCEAFIAVNNY